MIETKDLTRKFGDFTAVKAVNLKVRKGEILGLLGPNGAGKTTTISMLSTILPPSSGSALVAGHDVKKEKDAVRKSIGIVFQDPSLDEELTGFENLDFHGRLYGMPSTKRNQKIMELLEIVDLKDKRNASVKHYSGGMKRRLEIARGLMHQPKVLFLDEPTLGLDPQTRRHIWEHIKKMNEKGVTILLTTHYMEEADFLCDRVAIIDHGEIIALDKPSELKSQVGENVMVLEVSDPEKFCEKVKKLDCSKESVVGNKVHFTVKDGEKMIPKVIREAEKQGVEVVSVALHSPTLEDVFIRLTGRRIREEAVGASGSFRKRMMARRRRR
jgi:ABC-2 type transport system ATP-binding protein